MKEHYTLQIGSTKLHILSDEKEEYMASLAKTLEGQIDRISISSKQCGRYEAALLLALEYLDRSKKLEAELDKLKNKD